VEVAWGRGVQEFEEFKEKEPKGGETAKRRRGAATKHIEARIVYPGTFRG